MKDLVEPAVHGTQNVLSSVAKSKDTVKRVIQTSSFAGMPQIHCVLHVPSSWSHDGHGEGCPTEMCDMQLSLRIP